MKIVFWVLCVFFGTEIFSAPVLEDVHQETRSSERDDSQDYQGDRGIKNEYYAVSPCAAASSSNTPVAAFAPDVSYQPNGGLIQARYFNSEYGHPDYSGNWYRAEDPYKENREIMRYSDANFYDQSAMGNIFRSAPSSYAPTNAANMPNFNGHMAHQVGAAYGIFPNANVGDCNVPLLISCTPSIVTGQIVNPDSSGFDSLSSMTRNPSQAYRGLNGRYLHGVASHEQQTTNEHASISPSVNNNVKKNKIL